MSSCRDLCVPCCLPCETYCPKPWTDACNDLCVRYCEDSRAVIYPPPVAMTFPGAIFSSCPQESVVGSCGPVNCPCIPDCRPCSLRGSSYCGDSSVGRSIASCSLAGSNCGPCSPIWSCRRRCVPF